MNFFLQKNYNIKKNFFLGGEGAVRGGAKVSEFCYTEYKSLKKFFFGGWGGRGCGLVGGGGRWTDRRTDSNQFVPSTSSKLGA